MKTYFKPERDARVGISLRAPFYIRRLTMKIDSDSENNQPTGCQCRPLILTRSDYTIAVNEILVFLRPLVCI